MQCGILSYEKHIQEGSITVEQTYLTQNPVLFSKSPQIHINFFFQKQHNNIPDVMTKVRADHLVKA